MKRMQSLYGLGGVLVTAPLWMGASECEVAVVEHEPEEDAGMGDGDGDGDGDGPVVCMYGGKGYQVGDSFPDTDGCNSCACEADGSVACTTAACEPGDGTCVYEGEVYKAGATFYDECNQCSCGMDGTVGCTELDCNTDPYCVHDGKTYLPGDTWNDGCNDCSCDMEGTPVCTERACPDPDPTGACEFGDTKFSLGDSVICPDGCNHCGCNMDGWSSTDAACEPLQQIEECMQSSDEYTALDPLYLAGSALAVDVTYSGGCVPVHEFKLCWDASFLESNPVQVRLWALDLTEDACEALPTQPAVFDLSPLAKAYQEAYQTDKGTILLRMDMETVSYQFP